MGERSLWQIPSLPLNSEQLPDKHTLDTPERTCYHSFRNRHSRHRSGSPDHNINCPADVRKPQKGVSHFLYQQPQPYYIPTQKHPLNPLTASQTPSRNETQCINMRHPQAFFRQRKHPTIRMRAIPTPELPRVMCSLHPQQWTKHPQNPLTPAAARRSAIIES